MRIYYLIETSEKFQFVILNDLPAGKVGVKYLVIKLKNPAAAGFRVTHK